MRGVPWSVVVPFGVSGLTHLLRPQLFEPIIPTALRRWDRPLVLVSGVAELGCAAGLLSRRTRPAAGTASAALLVAVWPANVQMSVDLWRRAGRQRDVRSVAAFAVSVVRLPAQVLLIRSAWRARSSS